MQSTERVLARWRAGGGKVTPQRLFLLRALEHAETHPTAEDLYAAVRADLPTLSLATVYKTLAELVALGEVQPIVTGDGRTRYDPHMEPHAHVLCRRCGKLADVAESVVRIAAPMELDGFLVTGKRVVLEGYCRSCRAIGRS
jgi:Fe2+ or Zn2+ uptake regulation protein